MSVPLVVGGIVLLFMVSIIAFLAPRPQDKLDESNAPKVDVRITLLQRALFRSHQKRNDLTQELATTHSNLAKLSSEHDILKESHDNLTTSWNRVNEHNKTIKARNSDLDQEVKDLDQEVKSLWRRNKAIEDKNASLRNTCQASKTSIEDLATRLAALQTLYAQTYHQNTELKRSLTYVQEISAENARRATLSSSALRSAEAKMFDFQGCIAFHKHVVIRVGDAKAGLEKAVESLNETVKAQTGTVEDLGKELAWYKYAFDEAGAHAQWDWSSYSESSDCKILQDLVVEPVLVEMQPDGPSITQDGFEDVSAFSDTDSAFMLSLAESESESEVDDDDTSDFSLVELLESEDDEECVTPA